MGIFQWPLFAGVLSFDLLIREDSQISKNHLKGGGDPCENRTRVTAVKGRCLNRLTNGPKPRKYVPKYIFANGALRWTRTNDPAVNS